MRKVLGGLVSAGLVSAIGLAACQRGDSVATPTTAPSSGTVSAKPVSKTVAVQKMVWTHQKTEFEDDVLAAIGAFRGWPRLTRTPRWAPLRCDVPPPSTFAKAHISASDDEATHGKKLYHLYAMNPKAYFAQTEMFTGWGNESDPKAQSLEGFEQVLIKDAFVPVRAGDPAEGGRDLEKLTDEERAESAYAEGAHAAWRYLPGEAKGQFVMIKYPAVTGRARPGTDEGWVYATVSPAGMVTSAGRVASCMECHTRAPHGRLFGLEKPGPRPDAVEK